ncbi:UNVERIFIED_CONTAM: hypothetical protein GTU68_058635 [Idotea baltica]|nr:hypothetical protein [Idotea baltica]
MSDDEVKKLMEAALQSPTSFNIQNWRFLVVRDKERKQKLREASYFQSQVEEASAVIILAADLAAWEDNPERYWVNAPKDVASQLVNMIGPFYRDNPELQRDEAIRSVGIAGQTIMLAAKAMGYDSCPMIGFTSDHVASIINLPENHVLGLMITVGKALKPAWDKPGQLAYDQVVLEETF